jgi:hypothetical protein
MMGAKGQSTVGVPHDALTKLPDPGSGLLASRGGVSLMP